MTKDVDYYMGLPWEIEIDRIMPDFFIATIPLLEPHSLIGYASTKKEAEADLMRVMEFVFEKYIENDMEIPEPGGEWIGLC